MNTDKKEKMKNLACRLDEILEKQQDSIKNDPEFYLTCLELSIACEKIIDDITDELLNNDKK